MQADAVLLGAETQDSSLFYSYWNKVSAHFSALLALPEKIRGRRQEALGYAILAKQLGRADLAQEASGTEKTFSGMLSLADDLAAKIKKWMPTWKKQAQSSGDGLGALPLLIIGGAAVAVLGYVAVRGIELLKDYKTQEQMLEAVKNKTLSAAQAIAGMSASQVKTFAQSAGEGAGSALMYGGLAVAGVLALVVYQKFAKRS